MKHLKLMAACGLVTLVLGASEARADEQAEAQLLAALDSKVGRANALRLGTTDSAAPQDVTSLFRMAGIAGALALVAFAAAYVVKRRREAGWVEDGGPELSIKESVWVGRGQRLLLVSVHGQPVLVGATAQGMFGLGSVTAPASRAATAANGGHEGEVKNDPFSKYIDAAIDDGPRSPREEKRRMLNRLNSL